jgi:hypothetical protein
MGPVLINPFLERIVSLRLPLSGSAVRDLIDLNFLGSLAETKNQEKLPNYRLAIVKARNTIAENEAVRSVDTYCLRANGELWLIRVAAQHWTCLWNFGKLPAGI